VNGHCLEMGSSEGEVGRCTHSYSSAVDANSARVNVNDRKMTNLKRVTQCDRMSVTFRHCQRQPWPGPPA
jgi:hypothetical protein